MVHCARKRSFGRVQLGHGLRAQYGLSSSTIVKGRSPRPVPTPVSPHQLQRPQLGAVNRERGVHVRIGVLHLDDFDRSAAAEDTSLTRDRHVHIRCRIGNTAQYAERQLRLDARHQELRQPVWGQADRVCVRNSVVFDVLDRPACPANLPPYLVEIIVYGAARVVTHPAHRTSPFVAAIALTSTLHAGSDISSRQWGIA